MRTPPNDTALTSKAPAKNGAESAPERRCILGSGTDDRATLLRLAISPDGEVVPDVLARAPGRGAWLGVDRPTLEIALAKGKIKGALARAYKGAALTVPANLSERIDLAYRRTVLAQLGMAAKAGVLLTGAEKVDAAARSGAVAWLAHASDAAEDGRRKRDQSWRVGEDAEGSGKVGLVLPIDRSQLSAALGRDNAVHVAIIDAAWGARVAALLDRWQRYAGWARGVDAPRPDSGPNETTGQAAAGGIDPADDWAAAI